MLYCLLWPFLAFYRRGLYAAALSLCSFAFALWPLPFLAFCGEPLLGIWKRSGKKAKDREQENGKKEGKGTEEETKRNKRKQRTEKPEDKLYFIFVLVFLFVFFSFSFSPASDMLFSSSFFFYGFILGWVYKPKARKNPTGKPKKKEY